MDERKVEVAIPDKRLLALHFTGPRLSTLRVEYTPGVMEADLVRQEVGLAGLRPCSRWWYWTVWCASWLFHWSWRSPKRNRVRFTRCLVRPVPGGERIEMTRVEKWATDEEGGDGA